MMDAGRELDRRVAIDVMGEMEPDGRPVVTGHISASSMFESYPWRAWLPELMGREWEWGPMFYSTDIAHAWEVVEKLRRLKDGHIDIRAFTTNWRVSMGTDFPMGPAGRTAPHAICLAALRAVEFTA